MRKSSKMLIVYGALLLIAMITMFLLYRSIQQKRAPCDFAEISREGVLRMVTEYNSEGYYASGDTVQGLQFELSQAISDQSGLEVHMSLEMSLAKSFEGLNRKEYDVIARNIPVTTEMKEHFLFTDPIVMNRQVLVQRTADANEGTEPIRNHLNLAGKTLYIPDESPARLRIKNLEKEIGDSILIREEPLYSSEQLVMMVAAGEIDFAVVDHSIAQKMQKQFPQIDIQTDISFTQLQSWAVRIDSPVLLDSLNHWLRQIQESGKFRQILQKYYTNP